MGGSNSKNIENVFLKDESKLDLQEKLFITANKTSSTPFPDVQSYIMEAAKNPQNVAEIIAKYEEEKSKSTLGINTAIDTNIFMNTNSLQMQAQCYISLGYKMGVRGSAVEKFRTAIQTGNINDPEISRFIKKVQDAEAAYYRNKEKGIITKSIGTGVNVLGSIYSTTRSRVGTGAIFAGGYLLQDYSPLISGLMMTYGTTSALCVMPETYAHYKQITSLALCMVFGIAFMWFSGAFSLVLKNSPQWSISVLQTLGYTNITSTEDATKWAENWLANGMDDYIFNTTLVRAITQNYNKEVKPWVNKTILQSESVTKIRKINDDIIAPATVFAQKTIDVLHRNAETVKKGMELGTKVIDMIQSDVGVTAIDTLSTISDVMSEKGETIETFMRGLEATMLLLDANSDTIDNAASLAGGAKQAMQSLGILSKDTKAAQLQIDSARKEQLSNIKQLKSEMDDVYKKYGIKTEEQLQQFLDSISSNQGVAPKGGVGAIAGGAGQVAGNVLPIGM